MISFGNVPAGTVLYIPFHTFNAAGASVTISGLGVTDIEVYKNGSTTQRASDNGYTLLDTDGIDFDGITGIHGFSIDTGDNTDSGFYSAGAQYWVVVSAVTVDAQTVSFVAAVFRIEPAAGINANVVSNAGTAITAASGIQEVKVASIANNAITAASIASDAITDAKVASDVTIASVTGAVGSVTGNVGGNVTGSVGSIATGGIASSSFAAGAIDAAAIAADAIGSSELAASAVNEIVDQVWDELLSGHAVSGSTGEALSAAGSAGDPWLTALPGAYGAGTAGKIVGDNLNATVSSRATQTSVDDMPTNAELATALGTADDAVLAQVALVKAKTDSLTFTVAGNVDANLQYVNDTQIQGTGAVGSDEWRKV